MTRVSILPLLRTDFGVFLHKCFQTVSPGDAYMPNWHIEAIGHRLKQIETGKTQRLIINQPPRSLKSIVTSVAWPAWLLAHDPTLRIICVSYSSDLAEDLHRQFRTVVTSDWYRTAFPRTRIARNTDSELTTTRRGFRLATSVGGTLTGRGGDLIVIDDPHKAEEAQSEPQRRRAIDWFGTTLVSRLDDKSQGAIVLVMQRLHEDDLTGHLLDTDGGWDHLCLAAIANADEAVPIGEGYVHHRKRGEALHTGLEPLASLEKTKAAMGSLTFSAQYQQSPIPAEGNIVRREWFQWYDTRPEQEAGNRIIQSWDIASSTSENANWSVGTTWLVKRKQYYLLDVFRDRLTFPRLRRKVIDLGQRHKATAIVIENAGPGQQLLQDLKFNSVPGIVDPIGFKPDGSKVDRMEAQSARIEAGQVHLPKDAPWLDTFLSELLGFPHAKYDDQVDSVSQFLAWITRDAYFVDNTSVAGPILIPLEFDEPAFGRL